MYWSLHDGKIVGYMMLAMGHVGKTQQAGLGIDAYGHLPAHVIARLATDERHERNGVGRRMVSFAISLATKMATDVGCRVVLANSEPDAVGFYKKMGFARFAPRRCFPALVPRAPILMRYWTKRGMKGVLWCQCIWTWGRICPSTTSDAGLGHMVHRAFRHPARQGRPQRRQGTGRSAGKSPGRGPRPALWPPAPDAPPSRTRRGR